MVKKDPAQADKWFTKKLGKTYTPADQTESVYLKESYWLVKAADQGDKMSTIRQINIYSAGSKYIVADKNKMDYWNERYRQIF